MKLSTPLLVGSLVLNAALAAFAFTRPSPAERSAALSASSAETAAAAARAQAAALAAANHIDPKLWANLSQGDLPSIAARLRAEGFPLSLQRALLSVLVMERFADRHHALAELISAHPWWRGGMNGSASGTKITIARQQLQRDEKAALDELLGPDPGISDYARAKRARQYGADLSPAKVTELERLDADYAELIAEVRNASQGIYLPEDREKLAFLEKEKRADMAKILTPAELLEIDLRSSPTANQLRYQLDAFKPTDDEYRAIFKVQQAFDSKFPPNELMTTEQRTQRNSPDNQKALISQIQTVLPPDRFADYQLKTDPAYIQTNLLATQLSIPATAVADIVAVQKDITKRAAEVRADRTLSPDLRTQQLSNLAAEATLRLTPLLGEAGYNAYTQGGRTGYWLTALTPRRPAPPKP